MSISFTTTQAGATGINFEKYLFEKPVKAERYKDPGTLDFALAPGAGFVKLKRGAYITIDTVTYPKWFTGFITNEPELTYFGVSGGAPHWGYRYQATSDEYALNLRPIGIIEPFMNRTMGEILKALIVRITNSAIVSNIAATFDLSGIQDGPLVAQYTIDPNKYFLDVVNDLCEAASFVFRCNDKKAVFEPQDTSAKKITLDGNNKHFTPERLSIKPASIPVINDITVVGNPEPTAYVNEYFVGTGLDASFPLVSSVFGADSSVIIDDTFSGGAINGSLWNVYDQPSTYVKVDSGYLNVLGGIGDYSSVRLESANPIPLEGRLRLTHGEWDFISGNGVIGGLWTTTPSGSFSGCVYGLKVQGTSMSPIINGTADTSQVFTLDTSKRYVLRTVVEFSKVARQAQTFGYVASDGTRGEVGGDTQDDTALWSTVVTEVDPTNGKVTQQTWFRNTSTVTDAYARYTPVASSSLHATVTSVTVSNPINATLELAHNLQIKNGNFDEWDSFGAPTGWVNHVNVYEETGFVNNGSALKLDPGAEHESYITQFVDELIETGKQYTAVVRLSKTLGTAAGSIRIYLKDEANTFESDGLVVDQTDMIGGTYKTFSGVICDRLTEVPSGLFLVVQVDGSTVEGRDAFYIDDLVILSEYQQQIVGPNELDAVDGMTPVATIVAGNNGSETKSSIFGSGQFNTGQSQLVFFKDSLTRTSNIPPESQIIRLSYRAAGTAIGRSMNRTSIATEAQNWGDSGVRSVVRTDLSPRPRTSRECEMAAAALVFENSFDHYEGTYTQYSQYFSTEPKPGYILKFTNLSSMAPVDAEEINEVRTVLDGKNPETFIHTVTFGKPDVAKRLLSSFESPKGLFQKSSSTQPYPVEAAAADGTVYAPDVVKPALLWWDSKNVYLDAGQDLGSAGQYFEVRYTDAGWGVDDGKNLATRSTSRTITIPRNDRGRVVFIRQVNAGNHILWSEDITKSNYSSGGSLVSGLGPTGDYQQLGQFTLSSTPFVCSFDSSVSSGCFSFSIKGTAGTTITVTLGSTTKTFTLSGYWQRFSVTGSGSSASITAGSSTSVKMTRFSAESGTSVERMYSRTTSVTYGPYSRYPAVVHASFPATDVTAEVVGTAADASDITDPTGDFKYEDSVDGKSFTLTLFGAYVAPPSGDTFQGVQLYYEESAQAANDSISLDGTGKIDGTEGLGGEWKYTKGPRITHKEGAWAIPALDPVKIQTDMRVYFVSFNTDGKENGLVKAGQVGETPNVLITVAPRDESYGPALKYAPLAQGLKLKNLFPKANPSVYMDESGAQNWTATIEWLNPVTNPRYPVLEGYDIVLVDDENNETLLASVSRTENSKTIGPFPVKPQETGYSVRLISYSKEGRNEYAHDVTPELSITITPILGGPGTEFCDVVQDFAVGTPEYKTNGQGLKQLSIPVTWTDPADDKFGGLVLWFLVDGRHFAASGPIWRGVQKHEIVLSSFPHGTESWTLYALSQDKKNNPNTYVNGTTPEDTFDVSEPEVGGPGEEYTSVVTPGSPLATVQTRIVSDGGTSWTEWRVLVSWTAPDDPTFGGVKGVIVRYLPTTDTILTTYAGPTETSFVTPWISVKTGEEYKFYLLSVDVNGRENNYHANVTPEISGLAPVSGASGTTIDATRLSGTIPTAAYASNLVPPEIVSVLPTNFLLYPTGRLVVLTTDMKLYRSTGSAWTKAVDGADIMVNTVTAAQIVAGAIGTTQLATVEILVGGAGGKPPRFKVTDTTGADVAYIGLATIATANDFQGIWTKRLKVSPSLTSSGTTPRIELNNGVLEIVGSTFKLTGNGITTAIDNSAVTGGTFAGLTVDNGTSKAAIGSTIFQIVRGGNPMVQMYDNTTYGVLQLYGPSGTSHVVLDGQGALRIAGSQVVGARQAHINGPFGGFTVDAEARTVVNSILTLLQTHGLMG
jgi:hypothetical protein